eukprot:4658867-Pleurochrysis_carterae.AAC.1
MSTSMCGRAGVRVCAQGERNVYRESVAMAHADGALSADETHALERLLDKMQNSLTVDEIGAIHKLIATKLDAKIRAQPFPPNRPDVCAPGEVSAHAGA